MGKRSKEALRRKRNGLIIERDRLNGLIKQCEPLWDEHDELKPRIDAWHTKTKDGASWEDIIDGVVDLWQQEEINYQIDQIMHPGSRDATLVGAILDGTRRAGGRHGTGRPQ